MGNSLDVYEVDEASFNRLVIEQSRQTPVLVDFWADWCAPCKVLMPLLLKLAEEYQGAFRLAKVNTDSERNLAAQHAIRSLPTLRLYRNGEVVEELLGAQPESVLRTLLDTYIERLSDQTLARAIELETAGNADQALVLIEQAYKDDPGNLRLPLECARLAIKTGQLERAQIAIENLPVELQGLPESKALALLLELSQSTTDSPAIETLQEQLATDPTLSETRYRLAAKQALDNDFDKSLENFLELLRRDRSYRDGVAQRALVALFALIGSDDTRVTHYRRQMFNLLH